MSGESDSLMTNCRSSTHRCLEFVKNFAQRERLA